MSNSSMNKGHTAGGTPAGMGSSAARTDSDFVNYPAPGRHDRPGTCKLPTPRFSLGGDAARKAATGLALSIMAVAMLTGMQAQYGPPNAHALLGSGPVGGMDVLYNAQSIPAGNHGEIVSALTASLTDWREANPEQRFALGDPADGKDFVFFEWIPMHPSGVSTDCSRTEHRSYNCVIRAAIYEDAGNGMAQYRSAEQIGNSLLDGLTEVVGVLTTEEFMKPAPYADSPAFGTPVIAKKISGCLKVANMSSHTEFLPVIPQPDACLELTLNYFKAYKEHPWLLGGKVSWGKVWITKAIDGDTLEQNPKEAKNIRLALANTPEEGEPGYHEATAFTKQICRVDQVHWFDPDEGQKGGSHGRVIGEVICRGISLNGALVLSGHAEILTKHCKDSEFSDEFWAVEKCIPDRGLHQVTFERTFINAEKLSIPEGWKVFGGTSNESGEAPDWYDELFGGKPEGKCLLPTSIYFFGLHVANPLGCVA